MIALLFIILPMELNQISYHLCMKNLYYFFSTSVIRARSFLEGWIPSEIESKLIFMDKIIPMNCPKFLLLPIQTVSLMKILECMCMAPTMSKTSLILDLISGKIGSALYILKFVNLMDLDMPQMQGKNFWRLEQSISQKIIINFCQESFRSSSFNYPLFPGSGINEYEAFVYEILEMIGNQP